MNVITSSKDQFLRRYGEILVIAIVVFLGLLRVPEPFWVDQVPFMLYAEQFAKGALLYRDFWDIKPPGIYGVYLIAGKLFGFTGVGMHLLDGLWMIGLAAMLRLTLAQYFTRSWIAILLPWLSAGVYFSVLDPNDQMQVESLIGLPMYTLVWCTWQAVQHPKTRWRWLFLSGIAGGVILLFKLIFLPLIVGLWLVYLLHALVKQTLVNQKQPWVGAVIHSVVPVLLGISMPLIPVLLYWASTGMLGEAFYTIVQHPVIMIKNLPKKPFITLIKSIFSWFRRFAPLTVLSAFAIVRMLRTRKLDYLMIQMIVWLTLGLVTISIQTQSWWRYHFFLLLVPIAVLAAKGIDLALEPQARRWNRGVVAVCLLGVVGFNVLAVGKMGLAMTRSGLPFTPETQLAYQTQLSPTYVLAKEAVKFVNEPGRKPGPIYVIGDPTFYVLANRTQAIPLLGTISAILLPDQWTLMQTQLKDARPPYLYIINDDVQYIPASFFEFLNQMYSPAQKTTGGNWYEIK